MPTPSGRNLLAMFPGQGSQYVGMGKQCLAEFPYTKEIFEEAEDATKIALRRLCFEGPESELKLTANTQPCILTTSVAVWTVLHRECRISPELFAGHSLGEYSALVAAGKLQLGRAAYLVRQRGEAMQRAVPEGVGGMAAVLNFAEDKLAERCQQVSKGSGRDRRMVEIVNYNSPQQLVVAGHVEVLLKLLAVLETEDKIKAVSLPVSAPFHSSLMAPAREVMQPLLEESPLTSNATRVIPNVSGEVTDSYSISNLIQQIDNPVRWTQTLASAAAAGTSIFYEIGPGRVLFGLARRQIPKDAKVLHSDDLVAAVKEFPTL